MKALEIPSSRFEIDPPIPCHKKKLFEKLLNKKIQWTLPNRSFFWEDWKHISWYYPGSRVFLIVRCVQAGEGGVFSFTQLSLTIKMLSLPSQILLRILDDKIHECSSRHQYN